MDGWTDGRVSDGVGEMHDRRLEISFRKVGKNKKKIVGFTA